MEEEENVAVTPKPANDFDFGGYFKHSMENGIGINPVMIAQSVADLRKENPLLNFTFSDESYRNLSDTYGEEQAKKVKDLYSETLEMSSVLDKQNFFAPTVLHSAKAVSEGYTAFKPEVIEDMKADPVFNHNSFFRPFQFRTFQEAAEGNQNYFAKDGEGNFVKKKLKESESYDDVVNPWIMGFGGSDIVVATNKFVADHIDPTLKERIDSGELSENGYFRDEEGEFMYRELEEGEESPDKVRNIFGPESVYNSNLLKESAKGFYDGVLATVEGIYTLDYYIRKYPFGKALQLAGFDSLDAHYDKQFNSFTNRINRIKSASSMEQNLGWNHSAGNFSKAVFNGVGQIVGTFGVGTGVKVGLKLGSKAAKLARVGALSETFIADAAGFTSRALNFGIAAKAGKEAAMQAGLSAKESDLMGLVSGAIMSATEFMTGSQFIPKAVGRGPHKEIAEKIVQDYAAKAEQAGIKLGTYIAQNPGLLKTNIYKAHKWLESAARNPLEGFAKGFIGEAFQETTEDTLNTLVQDGYDFLTGTKKFNNDWNDVMGDLAGSFFIGGFSGGMSKAATSSKSKHKRQQIDDKRNNLIINEIAKGNYESLIEALDDVFSKEGFASKILSANRDEEGNKVPLSKDKGLNPMSENDFFKKVYLEQVNFAKKVHDELAGRFATQQELADAMHKYMGQDLTKITSNISDLAKGVRMAMEFEGMQLFREESLVKGFIALSVAKSKNKTAASLDGIEHVRFYDGKILAVSKNGEFQPPTVQEETALNQAYREFFEGDSGKGLEKLATTVKDRQKEISELEFQMERLKGKGDQHLQVKEVKEQLDQLDKDQQKDVADFKATLKDRGLDTELSEEMVELSLMNEFKDNMLTGERAKRYVRNFALNVTKENYPNLFPVGFSYDIEDYDIDEKRQEYFGNAFRQEQGIFTEATAKVHEEASKIINDPAVPQTAKVSLIKTVMQSNSLVNEATVKLASEYMQSIKVTLTDTQKDELKENTVRFASLVKLDTILDDGVLFALEELGTGHLYDQLGPEKPEKYLDGMDEAAFQSLKERLLAKTEDLADIQDELERIFSKVPDFLMQRNAFAGQTQWAEINAGIESKTGFVPQAIEDLITTFALNQNLKFADNYFPGESGIADALATLRTVGQDFIDNGELSEIIAEITTNYRFLVAKRAAISNDPERKAELAPITAAEKTLKEYLAEVGSLKLISDNNRGNRYNRDYEVKASVIANGHIHLSQISRAIGMDIEERLKPLLESYDLTPEAKPEIDAQYKLLQELEIEVSDAVRALSDTASTELLDKLGLLNIKYEHQSGSAAGYIFKSNHEDQSDPFNPMSDRDIAESKLNYLLMLGRGNLREYWTYVNEHLSSLKLDETLIPSQEQLFVTKQLFTKMIAGERSNIDRAVSAALDHDKNSFLPEAVFVRGIGGAGKSTFVVNLAFEIAARYNKDHNAPTNILYSAPTQDQINNVAGSFTKITTPVTAVSFSPSEVKAKFGEANAAGTFSGVNYIVIDEATVFDTNINPIVLAVKKHNQDKGNINKIKLILVGDELQNTGSINRAFIYSNHFQSYIERTIPLTTPYRSGKVESFDIQKSHREMLSVLLRLSEIRTDSKYSFRIPVTNETILIDSSAAKEEAYKKIVRAMLPDKSVSYTLSGGVISKGIRSFAERAPIVTAFAKDLAANMTGDDNNTLFITDDLAGAVTDIQKELTAMGVTATRTEIEQFVKESHNAQGLQFNRVYTDISPDSENTKLAQYILDLRSMYVAESRERVALTILDPGQRIVSKEVVSEESIPMFSEVRLDQMDAQKNLVDDSLALYQNNLLIAGVVKDLAGAKPIGKSKPEEATPKAGTTADPKANPVTETVAEPDENLNEETNLTPETMDEDGKKAVNDELTNITLEDIKAHAAKTTIEDSKRLRSEMADYKFDELCK